MKFDWENTATFVNTVKYLNWYVPSLVKKALNLILVKCIDAISNMLTLTDKVDIAMILACNSQFFSLPYP